MCAGVPVIGTDGGAKELIDVSGAGVFFPYNNVEMACNALKQVLETKAYANNGRAFAKSLSFDSYREKIKKIFEVVK